MTPIVKRACPFQSVRSTRCLSFFPMKNAPFRPSPSSPRTGRASSGRSGQSGRHVARAVASSGIPFLLPDQEEGGAPVSSVPIACCVSDATCPATMLRRLLVVHADPVSGTVSFPPGPEKGLDGKLLLLNQLPFHDEDRRSIVAKLPHPFLLSCLPDCSPADPSPELRARLEKRLVPPPSWALSVPHLMGSNGAAFPVTSAYPFLLQHQPSAVETWTLSFFCTATSSDALCVLPHMLRVRPPSSVKSVATMVSDVLRANHLFHPADAIYEGIKYTRYRAKDATSDEAADVYALSFPVPLLTSHTSS